MAWYVIVAATLYFVGSITGGIVGVAYCFMGSGMSYQKFSWLHFAGCAFFMFMIGFLMWPMMLLKTCTGR